MKILTITNLYPPHFIGGHELRCREIMDHLTMRGHEIVILASRYGLNNLNDITSEDGIFRFLAWNSCLLNNCSRPSFYSHTLKELQVVKRIVHRIKPNLIYLWNQRNINDGIINVISQTGIPAILDISDPCFIDKHERAIKVKEYLKQVPASPFKRLIKPLLAPYLERHCIFNIENLNKMNAYFTSMDLKDRFLNAGLGLESAKIIYSGIDLKSFINKRSNNDDSLIRLMYCGQIAHHKGVHTLVEAISNIINIRGKTNIHLTIIGPKVSIQYFQSLNSFILNNKLKSFVSFLEPCPRDKMPEVYNDHDILIFPSIWEEPFPRTPLEAFACGLAVVATTTGGSKEFLADGTNCLTFPPGDSATLAKKINTLIENSSLRDKLAYAGEALVKEKFDITRMIDEIEDYINEILNRKN